MTDQSNAFGFRQGLFSGKHVVVSGAGRGIGAAIASYLLTDGAVVFAHLGRPESESLWSFPTTREHPNLTTGTGDFTDDKVVASFAEKATEKLNHVDLLINNAGTMLGRVSSENMSANHYQRVTNLNAQSVIICTTKLLPALRRSPAGASIVNVTSISADTGGSPGSSIYSAAKGFVSTYTKSLATELAADNIRVNAISPGTIDTDFHQRYSSREKLERTANNTPLGRLGTASDCVPACLFLASPEMSGFITGQIIGVNGGMAF